MDGRHLVEQPLLHTRFELIADVVLDPPKDLVQHLGGPRRSGGVPIVALDVLGQLAEMLRFDALDVLLRILVDLVDDLVEGLEDHLGGLPSDPLRKFLAVFEARDVTRVVVAVVVVVIVEAVALRTMLPLSGCGVCECRGAVSIRAVDARQWHGHSSPQRRAQLKIVVVVVVVVVEKHGLLIRYAGQRRISSLRPHSFRYHPSVASLPFFFLFLFICVVVVSLWFTPSTSVIITFTAPPLSLIFTKG